MEPFPAGIALHVHHDEPILLQSRDMPLAVLSESAKKASNKLRRRASMSPGSVHMNGDVAWSREEGSEMLDEFEVLYKGIEEVLLMVFFPRGENVFLAQEFMDKVLGILTISCGAHLTRAVVVKNCVSLAASLDDLLGSALAIKNSVSPGWNSAKINELHAQRRKKLMGFSMIIHPSDLQVPRGVPLHAPASCKRLGTFGNDFEISDAIAYGEAKPSATPPDGMEKYAMYKDEEYELQQEEDEEEDTIVDEGDVMFDDEFGNAFDDAQDEADVIDLLPQYTDDVTLEDNFYSGDTKWEAFEGGFPSFEGEMPSSILVEGGNKRGHIHTRPRPDPNALQVQETWKLKVEGNNAISCSLVGHVMHTINGTRGMQEPLHFSLNTPTHLQIKKLAVNPRQFECLSFLPAAKTFVSVVSKDPKLDLLRSFAPALAVKYALNPSLCLQPLQVHATSHFQAGNGLSIPTKVIVCIDLKASTSLRYPLRDVYLESCFPEGFALPPKRTSHEAIVSLAERKAKWGKTLLDPGSTDTFRMELHAMPGKNDEQIKEYLPKLTFSVTFRYPGESFSGITLKLDETLDWASELPTECQGILDISPSVKVQLTM